MTPSLDPILEQWITRFRGPLVGLLASWGSNWGEAEELAQDTFCEAWLSIKRLRGSPKDSRVVGPWLRGIAANLQRQNGRKIRKLRHVDLPEEDHLAAPIATDETDERLAALRTAFAELRTEHQTVLRMFYLDEASTREVASLLFLTEKAVEGRLFQARRALREQAQRIHAGMAGATQ
ncbi:MAG: RNA polymerase sigma factor (sigma-70 family) [Planctomycetota bacterium]|jgi:RNA polymerase sigma factor (sigma-70 family)